MAIKVVKKPFIGAKQRRDAIKREVRWGFWLCAAKGSNWWVRTAGCYYCQVGRKVCPPKQVQPRHDPPWALCTQQCTQMSQSACRVNAGVPLGESVCCYRSSCTVPQVSRHPGLLDYRAGAVRVSLDACTAMKIELCATECMGPTARIAEARLAAPPRAGGPAGARAGQPDHHTNKRAQAPIHHHRATHPCHAPSCALQGR